MTPEEIKEYSEINANVGFLTLAETRELLDEVERLQHGCQQLEMASASAMALVVSHEAHIDDLTRKLKMAYDELQKVDSIAAYHSALVVDLERKLKLLQEVWSDARAISEHLKIVYRGVPEQLSATAILSGKLTYSLEAAKTGGAI